MFVLNDRCRSKEFCILLSLSFLVVRVVTVAVAVVVICGHGGHGMMGGSWVVAVIDEDVVGRMESLVLSSFPHGRVVFVILYT